MTETAVLQEIADSPSDKWKTYRDNHPSGDRSFNRDDRDSRPSETVDFLET